MIQMSLAQSAFLVIALGCGILVGCAPSETVRNQKSTSLAATSDAVKHSGQETQLAAPSRTPYPTVTAEDSIAAFEKCRGLAYAGLSYAVSVTSGEVTEVSLTLMDDTGETIQGEYPLPICMNFIDFSSGDPVSVSARITQPAENAGSIKCEILRAGGMLDVGYAEGFGSTAECDGTIP